MTDVREATADLLADRPDLDDDLRSLLALDADGPWTFDDTGLDSGTFGEIVSRGIVEDAGDGYRLADRGAVRRALDGDGETGAPAETGPGVAERLGGALPRLDRRSAAALAGALLVVLLARVVLMWPTVFRNGDVVLAGNDPYLYRYWGEQLLASDLGPLDLGSLGAVPGDIPGHDTLYVVVVWWTSALLGGDAAAVGTTLAWLPVLFGLVTAGLVYVLAIRLTDDRRIGLAAVLLLALTPTHAYRTALGFGDHHAFDYVWVGLTALSVVILVGGRLDTDRLTPDSPVEWLAVGGLAVGVAAQALAWRGGPLLSIPVGIALVGVVALAVRKDRSPLPASGPILLGTGLGALLTLLPHLLFGWAPTFRAFAPALLLVGCLVAVGLGVAAHRVGLSARLLVGAEVTAGLVAFGVALVAVPSFGDAFDEGLSYFVRTGQSGIAETYSLFSGEVGSLLGPILLFGFVFFLAVPYLLWGGWVGVRRGRADWLAAALFGGYFLVLAVVQSRFAGQLSLFTAVFGGVGFLHLAALIDVAERPAVLGGSASASDGGRSRGSRTLRGFSTPDGQTLAIVVALFLLVSSLGVVQTGVKQSQIAVDDDTYQTAAWLAEHAASTGETYPENYVLSSWGRNRVYNHFVSGESRSYGFARDHYGPLMEARSSAEVDAIAEDLDRHGVGYVLTQPLPVDSETVHSRLHDRLGSRGEDVPGLGRFRLAHVGEGGSTKVFEYVEGAWITGTAGPNETLSVETNVTVEDRTVTYRRQVTTNRYGDYGVRVPYAGEYDLGGRSVTVESSAATDGGFTGPYQSHWAFDEGRGNVTDDELTDATGEIRGGTWTDGVRGSALSFDGGDHSVVVREPQRESLSNASFTVSLWVRGDMTGSEEPFPHVLAQEGANRRGFGVLAQREANRLGVSIDDESGERVGNFGIQQTEFDHWTHVAFTVDRTADELRLYRNGTLMSTRDISGFGPIPDDGPLVVGGRFGNRYATGQVDSVRLYRTSLNETRLSSEADR
jgi:dolichyl-diphosphooligosaccharide--protein glycosyltransferase